MHRSLKPAAGALASAVLLLLGGVAGATNTQFPPATTVPGFPTATTVAPGAAPTTGVLVPDPTSTTAASPATTVGAGTVSEVDEAPDDTSSDPDAGRTVWMAIAGLGAVALLILVFTIVYARHTRPDRWHGGQDEWDVPDSPDDLFAPTAARSVFEHKDDEQGFWWAED